MSNDVFPAGVRGLTYAVTKTIKFGTIVQSAPNLDTLRISQTQNPVWTWWLLYEFIKDNPADLVMGFTYSDFQTLLGFIAARGGDADDFLFTDPDDNYVGPALVGSPLSANPAAELQVVTDGAGNYYSPIQRNLGGQFFEDITDLNGAIEVYANGVLQTSADYTIGGPGLAIPGYSFAGLYIAWNPTSPPTSPGVVSAEFNFYFRVRFKSATQDFDKFSNMLWANGGDWATNSQGLILESARNPQI